MQGASSSGGEKKRAEGQLSISSVGVRLHFDIALVLITIIPLLVFIFLVMGGYVTFKPGRGVYEPVAVLLIALVGLGYALLMRYPITMMKLRRYVEDMAAGVFPESVHLEQEETDLRSIEAGMNRILERLKAKVDAMAMEQAKLEKQLCKAQKLESIGALASGIAHEINTPIQFVGDNTRFLSDACAGLLKLLEIQRRLNTVAPSEYGSVLAEIQKVESEIDLPFLEAEIPTAISQSLDGLSHVAEISRALKDFARVVSDDEMKATDLNRAIQSSVTLTRNEWKYVAELTCDLDPALPLVPCFAGDIKQVLINLIVNAAHAVGEVVGDGSRGKGQIAIRARCEAGAAVVSIRDSGPGIPEAVRNRIFEPFFTTKKGGKGSGQGLAIARSLIVGRHGGQLSFDTELGKGTEFTIRLPIRSGAPVCCDAGGGVR